jgi:hypothetical protein
MQHKLYLQIFFFKNTRYTMDLPGFVPNNTNLGGEYPNKSIWMDTRVTRTRFQVCTY